MQKQNNREIAINKRVKQMDQSCGTMKQETDILLQILKHLDGELGMSLRKTSLLESQKRHRV